jgi:hypothetical protein
MQNPEQIISVIMRLFHRVMAKHQSLEALEEQASLSNEHLHVDAL